VAIKLKAISDITTKWSRRAGAAGPDYQAGVASPKASWAGNAQAAEAAYEAGVQGAIGRKGFGKGVREAGDEKWSRKTLAVGPARYGAGVTAGVTDFSTGFGPYRDALERISLPTKGAKGDPGNVARVSAIADALHSMKVGK